MQRKPVRVIVVTDGDGVASRAVETAASELGLRTISRTAGHPTLLTGAEMAELCLLAPQDPVVLMVDDRGHPAEGPGERALKELAADPRVEVLGVIAVAANTGDAPGAIVDESISAVGEVVPYAVDKDGNPQPGNNSLQGDTVQILDHLSLPVVVGLGDVGKGGDSLASGAPLTRHALEEVLRRHGIHASPGSQKTSNRGHISH